MSQTNATTRNSQVTGAAARRRRRRWMVALALVVILVASLVSCMACAPPLRQLRPGRDFRPLASRVDWQAAGDEAARVLSGYLQVDTRNPPGNETAGARFLAAFLQREGIESEIVEFAPGRGSLIARLRGSGSEGPLCLLSHIDVATADPANWPTDRGPVSGAIDDQGYVWGRGALDMKGMGVIELLTLVWLKRLGAPLNRDIVLLAVADEEVANQGMRHVVEKHWDRVGCAYVVNEGGLGLKNLFFEGQTVFPISVVEKGVLWLRLSVRGRGGHGSTPMAEHTTTQLVRLLTRLQRREARARIHPTLQALLSRVGAHRGGLGGFVLRRPTLVKLFLKGRLLKHPATRAAITDTVSLSGINTGTHEPNVIPTTATATLDCRLLPGTRPAQLTAELAHLLGDPQHARLETLLSKPTLASPADDPFFDALARRVVEGRPHAVAGPVVSIGFTDSLFARQRGARAYGLVPFEITEEEAATMHAPHERVSVSNLRDGLRVLLLAVLDVAGTPGAVPARVASPASRPSSARPSSVPVADAGRGQ